MDNRRDNRFSDLFGGDHESEGREQERLWIQQEDEQVLVGEDQG